MPPSLSELKVTPSFCFASKIPDNPTATNNYCIPIAPNQCLQVILNEIDSIMLLINKNVMTDCH